MAVKTHYRKAIISARLSHAACLVAAGQADPDPGSMVLLAAWMKELPPEERVAVANEAIMLARELVNEAMVCVQGSMLAAVAGEPP